LAGGLFLASVSYGSAIDQVIGAELAATLSITTNVDASGKMLTIPITPTGVGSISSRKLTVNVSTNNPTGYTMTMSSDASGNALTRVGGAQTIAARSASVASPAGLSVNTWGFAVPKTQTNATGLMPNDTNNFDNSYTELTNAASSAAKYAAVPLEANALTLKATEVNLTQDLTDVFFGSNVNVSTAAGNYRGTVVFTAVANYVAAETPTTMQGMTAAHCDSMSVGDTLDLIDTRDSNIYTIAKIGSRCWMAQNLALGDTSGEMILTPDDSNVEEDWVLSTSIADGAESDDANSVQWLPANANSNSYCAPIGGAECGNLYNWYTATVGHASMIGDNSAFSICPAGWYLPTGGSDSDFEQLDVDLGGNGTNDDSGAHLISAPWSAVLADSYYSGLLGEVGYYGYYWSSTGGTKSIAYSLAVSESDTYPQNASLVSYGMAVRCVLNT
jgi:uncharacterized protein (TIGR02145 family)